MRRRWWLLGLLPLGIGPGCDSQSAPSIPVMRRPISLAVTCAATSGESRVLEDCTGEDGVWTSWVLDGDARGLVVAHGSSTDRFDWDPFEPGWTPIPVDGEAVAVRASSGSDLVLVALKRDDATGEPALAWLDPRGLRTGLRLDRAPLDCEPIGMEIQPILGPEGNEVRETVILLANCGGVPYLVLLPVDDLRQVPVPPLAGRRMALSARPIGVRASSDGRTIFLSLRGEDRDRIQRIDLDPETGAIVSGLEVALPAEPGDQSDGSEGCPEERAAEVSGYRLGGAPEPDPDGRYLYLPLESPYGVLILDAMTLQIEDPHLPTEQQQGNPLLRRLGIRYLPLSAPVRAIAMVHLPEEGEETATDSSDNREKGTRAYAMLESGLLVRMVVDPRDGGAPRHRLETEDDDVESVATMPVTILGERVEPLGVVRHPEWPSFGMPGIESDPEQPGRSIYYGIRFPGPEDQVLNETWEVVYEGILPGARGCGFLSPSTGEGRPSIFEDPEADFCELGVRDEGGTFPGDLLLLRPDQDASCEEAQHPLLEYRIVAVEAHRLLLEPAYATLPLPAPGCLEGRLLRYEIRASGHWVVSGSRSGFLHSRTSSGGQCLDRGDASPFFTGRAWTTLPEDGGEVLQACPLRIGDSRIGGNWLARRFRNASFAFNVVPGCQIDSRYRPVVIPPERGTRLVFQTTSGVSPRSLALGGAPRDLVRAGVHLFLVDSATRLVYQVNAVRHEVVGSWF